MRPKILLSLLAVASLVTALVVHGVRAQDIGPVLYVSGLEVGPRDTAILRIHNAARSAGDVYSLRYTVRHTDAGQPLSFPGAGDGARLVPGEILELDLGAIVNAYRASLELGSFEGPIQVVAFGTGGVREPFGPDTVIVEALQRDRKARFAPLVEWR